MLKPRYDNTEPYVTQEEVDAWLDAVMENDPRRKEHANAVVFRVVCCMIVLLTVAYVILSAAGVL